MKTIGNVLWHIPFLGFVNSVFSYTLGLIFTITVIGAPLGLGLMQIGKFFLVPFGNTLVSKKDLNMEQNKSWKFLSIIVTIIYFPIGLIFAITSALQGFIMLITIIGIPVGLVVLKSVPMWLNPINKVCVSTLVAEKIENNKAEDEIEKYNLK